jgi:hypothetical protein
MSTPLNASVAMVRVAGHSYPAVMERSCRTCSSRYREEIERQLIEGRTGSKIVATLPEDADLTARNVADHFRNGHLPVHEATVQALVDQQADHRGDAIQPAVDEAVDHVAFARGLLSRVRERVAKGELEPDIRDGLRAAEFVAKYEPADSYDENLIVQAFIAYHDAASKLMTSDQFTRFGDLLQEDETLRRLDAEWSRQRGES